MKGSWASLAVALGACSAPEVGLPGTFALESPSDGATVSQPGFRWSASFGATGYRVLLNGAEVATLTGTQLAPGVLALADGTPFSWQVEAIDSKGTTAAANGPFSFTTNPAAPSEFSLVGPAGDAVAPAVRLQWTEAVGAIRYEVEVTTDGAIVYSNRSVPAGTTALDVELSPATSYAWRVTAVDGVARRLAANAPLAFTTLALPGTFALLAPDAGAALMPALSWTSSAGADGYAFQLAGGALSVALSLPASVTSYSPQLADATAYTWSVTAQNAAGSTAAQNAPATFTTGALPGPFVLLEPIDHASDLLPDQLLTWTPSAGAQQYEVELNGVTHLTSDPSLLLNGIAPGSTFLWRVTASNGIGSRSAGPFTFSTTPGPTTPMSGSPADGATAVGNAPSFGWQTSLHADQYTFVLALDAALTNVVRTEITTSTALKTELANVLQTNQTYYWHVIAKGRGGTATSATWSFTTGAPPAPFTLVSPADGAAGLMTSPTFTWTNVFRATWLLQIAHDAAFTQLVTEVPVPAMLMPSWSPGALCPLLPLTTYYWRVIQTRVGAFGFASNAPRSFTTGPGPSGGLVWGVSIPSQTAASSTDGAYAIAVDPTGVYVGGELVGQAHLEKRDLATGARLWSVDGPVGYGRYGALALDGDQLYAATNGLVEKRDATTGALDPAFPPTSSTVYDDTLAVSGGSVYLFGDFGGLWRLERRSSATGALADGGALDIAVAGHGVAVVPGPASGYLLGSHGPYYDVRWRLEARDLVSGALQRGFADGGVVELSFGSYMTGPRSLVLGGSVLYAAGTGFDPDLYDSDWRIAALSTTDGAPVTAFADGGVWFSNPTEYSTDQLGAAVGDGQRLFVGGTADVDNPDYARWRVQVLNAADGAPDSTWGTDGIIECEQPSGVLNAIAVDAQSVYLAGRGDSFWRIERRIR